jgi:hypothetical protein
MPVRKALQPVDLIGNIPIRWRHRAQSMSKRHVKLAKYLPECQN